MKKFIATLLCFIMLLSLFSCRIPEDKTNTHISPESANNESDIPVNPDAEKAMEMYNAAIKGETSVIDESSGEIKLKDCRFKSDSLKLDEYDMLNKAILDIDGDGINEYVIQSPQKDHIILRYYDGKIYSYSFEFKSLSKLNTDGTYFWYSDESALPTIGHNQITFNGSSIVIKELCRLTDVLEVAEKYYLDGC